MANTGTKVTYNDVTFNNVVVESFTQEPVYDGSDTDQLYIRYRVRIAGIVHTTTNAPQWIGVGGAATGAAAFNAVHDRLWEQGRKFVMWVGDTVILRAHGARRGDQGGSAGGPDKEFDCNNGPKPRRMNVTRISGDKILRISYEIEISRKCPAGTQTEVLNNRWSAADSMDNSHGITRTIAGQLRAPKGTDPNVQEFRDLVMPPLQPGFQRRRMRFVQSEDTLTLNYEIEDVQRWAAAPSPATDWTCTHTETISEAGTVVSEIVCRLVGPQDVDKAELIQRAAQILDAKLGLFRLNDVFNPNKDSRHMYVMHAAIIDNMHDSSIEMRVRVKRTRHLGEEDEQGRTLGGLLGAELGTPLEQHKDAPPDDYDHLRWVPPSEFMNAGLTGRFINYLQTPCDDKHRIEEQEKEEDENEEAEEGEVEIEVREMEEIPPWSRPPFSDDHEESMYDHYRIQSEYKTRQNKIPLPVARRKDSETPNSHVHVTLARPTSLRVVRIQAERIGQWPQIPVPQDYLQHSAAGQTGVSPGNVKAHLIDYDIKIQAPESTPEFASLRKSVDVRMVWSLDIATHQKSELLTGSLPWDNTRLLDNVMPLRDVLDENVA